MLKLRIATVLALLGLGSWAGARYCGAQEAVGLKSLRTAVLQIARMKEATEEDTHRVRNEALNRLYRAELPQLLGNGTGGGLRRFNALLKECGLSTFEDFLAAETLPVRDVTDPGSGRKVTVMGALGSDLINPWLVTAGIVDGKNLEEQPMYDAAAHALREHTDFALIGEADPALSLDGVPEGLRENVRIAYRRLNPGNRFAGGFDHPLYYAALREAARKLFRVDYPAAKLTMDRLVIPESKGGFGIASCLLCHGQNHTDVYKRLLGEAMHFEGRVAEKLVTGPAAVAASHEAEIYHKAAKIVLDSFPDKVDAAKARESLAMNNPDNVDRLKPGYEDFVATLDRLGCLKCHSTTSKVDAELRPDKHGAYMLNPNSYHKVENIKALSGVINLEKLKDSELLRKVAGKAKHRGSKELKLQDQELAALESALTLWMRAFLK